MTDVTAVMWSACSGHRADHWRNASAIGSKGSSSGTRLTVRHQLDGDINLFYR
jgi:hypothetical protein